jgi:DsbC/DsbD-like thiol-disulfide interchange protein
MTLGRLCCLVVVISILLIPGVGFHAAARPQSAPDIGVNGFFSVDKAPRGRLIQAAVVIDIPQGFHVNANRPGNKYAIPTVLKIEAPSGIVVGPVNYPRAVVRRLKAVKNEPLATYEGHARLRFNVTVPDSFQEGPTELKARLRFQSCNDDVCFPPQTRDISMPITVVGARDPVKRINGEIFGNRRRG